MTEVVLGDEVSVTLASGGEVATPILAACPEGTHVISRNFRTDSEPDSRPYVASIVEDIRYSDTEWKMSAINEEPSPLTVTVQAICLR
jgi:hypothetical protein